MVKPILFIRVNSLFSTMLAFIDNTAAESALVKAGSPTETMCHLALIASATLASLNCRPWYEHVASDDNPADVLSRDGYNDPQIAARVKCGDLMAYEPIEPPATALNFDSLWRSSA